SARMKTVRSRCGLTAGRLKWQRSPVEPGVVLRRLLHVLPCRLELVERLFLHPLAGCRDPPFDLRESAEKFVVGAAQRGLGLDPKLPRQVGDCEEQIAQLFFDGLVAQVTRVTQVTRVARVARVGEV